jgi:hypothetical protein
VFHPHPRTWANALGLAVRHQVQRFVVKAHHLGVNSAAVVSHNLAARTQWGHDAAGLKRHANQANQGARLLHRRRLQPGVV